MDFTQFRKNLDTLIKTHDLTPTSLSAELGMSKATINRYLSGHRTPDLPYLMQLATYFDVSLDWLLGFSDNRAAGFSASAQEVANMYEIASPDDRKVVQAVLGKYRKE